MARTTGPNCTSASVETRPWPALRRPGAYDVNTETQDVSSLAIFLLPEYVLLKEMKFAWRQSGEQVLGRPRLPQSKVRAKSFAGTPARSSCAAFPRLDRALTARLAGRRAIVTGAADGIGAAIASAFAAEGAEVIAADIQVDRLTAEYRGVKGVSVAPVDLRGSQAASDLVRLALERLGGLDILVNSAGVRGPRGRLAELSDEDWREVMSVNLDAMFYMSRAAAGPLTGSSAGRIVNIGSISSLRAVPDITPYTASKHGVLGLTRALACDLARDAVTVNAILPGLIGSTGLTRDMTPERVALVTRVVPLQRLGVPQDIAAAAVFLASDEASFITGAGLAVDGGATAAH